MLRNFDFIDKSMNEVASDKNNFAFESKDSGGKTVELSKKHGLFRSPQPKQLFAKLKQKKQILREQKQEELFKRKRA